MSQKISNAEGLGELSSRPFTGQDSFWSLMLSREAAKLVRARRLTASLQPRYSWHQTSHSTVAHPKTPNAKLRHPTKRIPWTKEEDETLVKMKEEEGCSWKAISDALPSRTPGAIQVRYSTKLSGSTGSRKCLRPWGLLSAEVISPAE